MINLAGKHKVSRVARVEVVVGEDWLNDPDAARPGWEEAQEEIEGALRRLHFRFHTVPIEVKFIEWEEEQSCE